MDPLGSAGLWAWIGLCPVFGPWVRGFIAISWCLCISLWHVTWLLWLCAYFPFTRKSWAVNYLCKHDFIHDKAQKQAWRVSPIPRHQVQTDLHFVEEKPSIAYNCPYNMTTYSDAVCFVNCLYAWVVQDLPDVQQLLVVVTYRR